ncbi:T9SS type A sorting domain-containing protein [Flavobacterium sp.]|uniref:T9SS type A sorting domain-containing protein n=1 Tax=Flavobacterium sp. TaxID=239 RepID=UPI002624555E|nr:T9SS type A sorting domain-containing protein [Flavobacterium sp.]
MKKSPLLITLLICFNAFSQFNRNAPWMQENPNASTRELSIDEIKQSFDEYWINRDKKKKGSGYKPFMRWENHWRNNTNENGFLITPQQTWDAFNQKKARIASRSSSAVLVPTSNWQPIGPISNSKPNSIAARGRVNIVHVDPSNPNTLYMGTPAGGIWKSINSGTSWTPLSDNLPQIGVSGIAVDYSNSNVIYIATGDKDATDTYSIGVLKSTDGGSTWNTTGLSFTNTSTTAGDIVIHPTNNQILWCATSVGLYKTTDAGATWTVVQAGDFAQGTIRLKPNDPTVVYATSNNRFYRSTNSGTSFSVITTGLPTSNGRMILDVTPANSNYIYILASTTSSGFQGIYRSINGGTTWIKTSGTVNYLESTQAWYDLALAVSPTNANELYTGCLNIWKSTDGGATASAINSWSNYTPSFTHADIHYLGYFNNKLYCGSDGGIYVSDNGGTVFTDKTGEAQIGQFYKISVSKQTASKISGGTQDNGGYAYSSGLWRDYHGGDGMDNAISPVNSNIYYGFIYNGDAMYISSNSGTSLSSSVTAPTGESGNWVTPLIANNSGEVYSGFTKLFKLNGSGWTQQSTGNIGSGNIDYLAVDPSNDDIMYVSNGAGLYKSTDRGINFSLVYTASSSITSVDVHSSNSSIVYLTTAGTSGLAMKSVTGGTSFTSFSEGLPNIGKNIIVHQGRNLNNPLYIGTTLGVYYRDDTMTQWEPFETNLPNVPVTDLEINLEDSKIIAATYGRGVWQTDIPVVAPNDDIKFSEIQAPTTVAVSCNGNVNPQVSVKNNGLNPISSVSFNYSINATPYTYNWTGTINPIQTISINLPSTVLTKGAYTLNINSTIVNDAFNDNNSGSSNFYLNDAGTVNVTNPFDTVASELLEYNEGSTTGLWTRGARTGGMLATGTNQVYATTLSGNYPDLVKSYLVSQCYNLTTLSSPQISFKMAYDLEVNWDLVYVQYTTDGGQNWNVLGSVGANWYNSDRTPETAGNDCYNCVGAQWTGTNAALTTYTYSLAALSSESNVIFRFVFQSDEAVNNQGVVIDDFLISGTLANADFEVENISIYPNPSNGIFNIASGNLSIEKVEVYDVTGKVIKSNSTGNNSSIDLTDASSGIYFVKITANEQSTVKRIIKK